jgi:hypothetical protein
MRLFALAIPALLLCATAAVSIPSGAAMVLALAKLRGVGLGR